MLGQYGAEKLLRDCSDTALLRNYMMIEKRINKYHRQIDRWTHRRTDIMTSSALVGARKVNVRYVKDRGVVVQSLVWTMIL